MAFSLIILKTNPPSLSLRVWQVMPLFLFLYPTLQSEAQFGLSIGDCLVGNRYLDNWKGVGARSLVMGTGGADRA
jgi:hypothetical protein